MVLCVPADEGASRFPGECGDCAHAVHVKAADDARILQVPHRGNPLQQLEHVFKLHLELIPLILADVDGRIWYSGIHGEAGLGLQGLQTKGAEVRMSSMPVRGQNEFHARMSSMPIRGQNEFHACQRPE
jgi:hypothetical protein